MKPETIIIKPIAFEGIIKSAYETARKTESFGFLFGEAKERKSGLTRWFVDYAYPLQSAERFPQSIDYDEKIVERVKIPMLKECIGDYHSHITTKRVYNGLKQEIPGESKPSETDEEDMIKKPDNISLIIGLKKVKKMGLLVDNPLLISGYLRDNKLLYRIDMAGYYHNGRKRRAVLKTSKKALKLIR